MKRLFVLFSLLGAIALSSEAKAETKASSSASSSGGTNLFASSGRFGLGLGTGTFATGVSGKMFFSENIALQGILGLGYGWGFGANINVDAVYEMPKIWGNEHLSINWHIGAGGALAFYGSGLGTGFGIEAVGGPSLQLAKVPFEFVVDIRPTYYFGWNDFYFGSGASARYFF